VWARVKGKTENVLLRLPFKAAYMFRPGIIAPRYGAKSRKPLYRAFYTLGQPLFPLLRWAFPDQILTTEQLGRAVLAVARHGFPRQIWETEDIRAAAEE
jgi:hypothetical protein